MVKRFELVVIVSEGVPLDNLMEALEATKPLKAWGNKRGSLVVERARSVKDDGE